MVDNFAGGGGASTGIEAALGRPVDIAINHDAAAIAMHKANHPETKHYQEDIWQVDPREAAGGRPVGLLWASPDCTHFSRAKGTQPRKKEIRALAWVVIRWAETVRPRVILLENVEEFQTWGPLGEDGRPDPAQLGTDFRAWLAKLTDLGYQVAFKSLVAADFGSPTTRRRLFLIARCDGGPLVFPEPTHGKGRAFAWRPASEVIDWSLPCPSIFERTRPLAEATMKRIAAGIKRFVIESADPFVIPLTHQGDSRVHSIQDPFRTITAANRGELALVNPFISTYYGQSVGRPSTEPLGTVTGCIHHALVEPFIGHYSTITGAGLREGCGAGTFRGQSLRTSLGTVCATNDKHLVCPVILKHYGGVVGHRCDKSLGTVTAKDHHALATAALKFYGGRGVTSTPRSDLVMVCGEAYQIVDIGMRMLQPHELFAAQGFPADYDITCESTWGKPLTKTDQTALAGNSVCPDVARALVAANLFGERSAAA